MTPPIIIIIVPNPCVVFASIMTLPAFFPRKSIRKVLVLLSLTLSFVSNYNYYYSFMMSTNTNFYCRNVCSSFSSSTGDPMPTSSSGATEGRPGLTGRSSTDA